MTLFKRAAAAALCAVMFTGGCLSAFAETNEAAPGTKVILAEDGTEIIVADLGTETTIIDTGETSTEETTVTDQGESTETTIIDPDDGVHREESGSGLDVSNRTYSQIDLSGYTLWDGKTKMVAGTDYYIEGKVAPRINFSVPQGSRLVLKSGSQLVIYKNRIMNIRGILVVEPEADFTASGKITIYEKGGVENYGTMKASVSSSTRIAGDMINRSTGELTLSGEVNVYKKGILLNYGQTTLTSSSRTRITGDFQTPETGRLLLSGYLAVTINGRTTQAGYFSLTGEVVNSGVFVFERTVRYYKSKTARFAVSKSSRLIDYRYVDSSTQIPQPVEPDKPDNPGGDEEASEDATDIGIKGIDVSYAQGAIDWAKVKASGIEFAMLRSSRGPLSSTRPASEDTTFKYNITEAAKAGIYVGVYHYLYAETVADARKEAKFFLKTIAPYKITYPVVLDVEEQQQAALGKSKITKIVKAFLDEVSAAGYYTMLYSNKTWLTQYLDVSQLSEYDVWLAQWNTVPTYKGNFGMWQYTCRGIVSGIDGFVDLNLSYKNYAKIIKKAGLNNL